MRWNTCISIHALLAESDSMCICLFCGCLDFYPRSPCGERPNADIKAPHFTNYFYPRSPCGERQLYYFACPFLTFISIHALLAESDNPTQKTKAKTNEFLSTLSLRRATVGAIGQLQCIHDFYPRSPCGERPAGVLPVTLII